MVDMNHKYPVTKNIPINHARISKQMNWLQRAASANPFICLQSDRDKSVYFWSQGRYSLCNATKADKFREKTNPI